MKRHAFHCGKQRQEGLHLLALPPGDRFTGEGIFELGLEREFVRVGKGKRVVYMEAWVLESVPACCGNGEWFGSGLRRAMKTDTEFGLA